jgi:hypothetical protein
VKLPPKIVARPILVALGLLFVVSSAFAQAPERVRILIGFRNPPNPADEGDVRRRGGEISHRYHIVPAMAVSIPVTALDGVRRNPNVTVVEPDGTVNAVDAELDAAWGVSRIGAGTTHAGGTKGAGIRVAIIDTGIDCTHPDLDGNCMGGVDFVNDDNDPSDDHGHGTHVAGTVAAEDDGSGVVGVAPEASLYGLKVLSAGGGGYWSDIIAAIEWAADNGIQVTNNSYGSSVYPGSIVEAAFDRAYDQGVLHIAAAGNSGSCTGTEDVVGYPARFASVVAVAATTSADARACFSSTGRDVEIAAPGVYINSTRMGGGYVSFSGTSMASPHVAGVAALVIASGFESNEDVRQRLDIAADDLGTPGRDTHFGFGLVDPDGAISTSPNAPPQVTITGPPGNSRFDSDTPVHLTGTGLDFEDGDLTPYLEWTSDLDGPLGIGGSISVSLSEGAHTIRLSTSDAQGETSSDSILLTVTTPALPGEIRVASILYTPEDLGRPRNPLYVTVSVVDAAGLPSSGAEVVLVVRKDGRKWRRKGFTGEDGRVTVRIGRSPRGCFVTRIRNVRSGGLTWDRVTPGNRFCQ